MTNTAELKKVDDFFEAIFKGEIEKKDWIYYFEDVLDVDVDSDDEFGNDGGGPFYTTMVQYFSDIFSSEKPLPEKYLSELQNPTMGNWYLGVVNFGSKERYEEIRKKAGYSIAEYGTYEEENERIQKSYEDIICECKTYGDFAGALADITPHREEYDPESDDFDPESLNLV